MLRRSVLFAVAAALGACLVFSQAAHAQPKTTAKIRIIGTLPLNHYLTDALKLFKKEAEEASKGKLQVDIFPAGQLYNDRDAVKALPSGAIDMGIVQLDIWSGIVPIVGILHFTTYYQSLDHYLAIRSYVTPQIAKDLEEKANVRFLGWADYDWVAISSKKRIAKLEDFSGTKMRGYGEYSAAFLQAVGSSPVVMSSSEAYDALSKGTIDGTFSGPTSQLSRKFYEVTKYLLYKPDMFQPSLSYAIVIGTDTWKGLSPELQQSVQVGSRKVEEWTRDVFVKESNKAIEALTQHGITLVEFTPAEMDLLRKRVWPVLEKKYVEQVGPAIAEPILKKARELRKN